MVLLLLLSALWAQRAQWAQMLVLVAKRVGCIVAGCWMVLLVDAAGSCKWWCGRVRVVSWVWI